MKVKVKDLKPNPYRDIEHYPINRIKVQNLKDSIEQSGFWDNILAREINGEIQLAYGHHRDIALKELGIEEVDIPVKDIDDATMIQIMANENLEQWDTNISVMNESVKVARNFLDCELAKYETWEDMKRGSFNIINLLDLKFTTQPERGFQILKSKGVGQTTILKFLGKGWKQWMIQDALDNLKEEIIDRKTIETFNTPTTAREFKRAVKEINTETPNKITREEIPILAEKIQRRIANNKSKNLGNVVRTMVRQEVEEIDEFDATLKDIELEIEKISNDSIKLADRIASLNGRLHTLGIENIKSLNSIFTVDSLSNLYNSINVFSDYLGFKINNQLKEK